MFEPSDHNSLMDIETLKKLMREHGETQAGLARMLGITPDKFSKTLKGTRQLKLDEANKLASYFGSAESNISQVTSLLPIIGLVSAGSWQEAIEHARGYMPSPDKTLSRDAFVVEVEGDSMDLVAKEGDGIIVDPRDLDLMPGRYYIVRNSDGETTFKRYMDNPARLEPCSSNPVHQPIYPGRDSFTVVGRAKKRVADL
jgi:repressor LexA